MVALSMDDDDEPVAEDDEADGGGAQEVDVAVAVGGRLGGLVGGVGPDGHGQWSILDPRRGRVKNPLSAKGREGARRTPFLVRDGPPGARSGLGANSRAPTRGAPTGIGDGSVKGVGHGWRVDLGTHEGCPYGYGRGALGFGIT